MKTAKNPEQQMVEIRYDYDDASNIITRTKTLSTGTWTCNYDAGTNGKGRMVSMVDPV